MSPSCYIINSALRVELSSDLGLDILGTLAIAVLYLIALWIIESVGQPFSKKFLVRINKEKEQRMGHNNRSRIIASIENIGTGAIGSSLLMLNS